MVIDQDGSNQRKRCEEEEPTALHAATPVLAGAASSISLRASLRRWMRSSVAPFFPRFHREGVVGAISARLQIAAMGIRFAFARWKRLSRGSICSIGRQNIGSNA